MFKSTNTGMARGGMTFLELVSLFRRPLEPIHVCATRGCGCAALNGEVMCEEHEIHARISYYDPRDGWTQ